MQADKQRLLADHFDKLTRDAQGYFHDPAELEQAIHSLRNRRAIAEAVAASLQT